MFNIAHNSSSWKTNTLNKTGKVYKHDIEGRSRNNGCRAKARSVIYSACISVALVIQHAKSMRRVISSLWYVWLCHISYTLSHKRLDFHYKILKVKAVILSVTSPLCSIINKYIDTIICQNTTQFMYICTIYFTTTCFGPF